MLGFVRMEGGGNRPWSFRKPVFKSHGRQYLVIGAIKDYDPAGRVRQSDLFALVVNNLDARGLGLRLAARSHDQKAEAHEHDQEQNGPAGFR